MGSVPRVLVTGAEEHQGLAVVRGLGAAGIEVVACGSSPRSLAFASRYATERRTYISPSESAARFVDDVLAIARETQPTLIMPSVETTLVALNAQRARVEAVAPLAAPAPEILEYALDKAKTLELAQRVGVPTPATAVGDSVEEILSRSRSLRFPVAVKPRGNALHDSTVNSVGFKSRYAGSIDELARMLRPRASDAAALLVQAYARGTGRCVATVFRDGEPLELFAYARDREFPLSGGVSVLRRSIPLDEQLREYTCALLRAIRWTGIAMVEFKFDHATGQHVLMEINGRFQASTALSLDAGLNLPLLAACVFTGWTPPASAPYRTGVEERWLRGDLYALRDALRAGPTRGARSTGSRPRRRDVLRRFLEDFRRGMHYDEFARGDTGPALEELGTVARFLVAWALDALKAGPRYAWKAIRS